MERYPSVVEEFSPHNSYRRDGPGPGPPLSARTAPLENPTSPSPSPSLSYQFDGIRDWSAASKFSTGGQPIRRNDSSRSLSVDIEPEQATHSPPPTKSRSRSSLTASETYQIERKRQKSGTNHYPGGEPIRSKYAENPNSSSSVEVEPEWVTEDIKLLFNAVYRRHGSFKDRRELNIRYQDVGCLQCAAKGKPCPVRPTALQCGSCPSYIKCSRVPVLKRLRVTEIMKISDEQYEWLLNWYKKTADDELLKDVRQEVASKPAEDFESARSSNKVSSKSQSSPSVSPQTKIIKQKHVSLVS
ncbi:hypothetical protein GYMLUDRAFT_684334 [Collybiopsis luxurians FD-317 M1]|uniref:Uncharacterized protein n=1 Tax=Collybiopsis luxurians FD-317 M1 TaxID=944289 RepID=A0A0D0B6T8_9AGAR|nr:hypothetical protein GYMLUDRAFT_684334 [Collybiopsis luxurians FD-317 M1]